MKTSNTVKGKGAKGAKGGGQVHFLGMTSREENQGSILKCELWCHP
jgi:hypothetical protein